MSFGVVELFDGGIHIDRNFNAYTLPKKGLFISTEFDTKEKQEEFDNDLFLFLNKWFEKDRYSPMWRLVLKGD